MTIGTIYIPDEGPLDAKIAFIGETGGVDEERGTEDHPGPGPFLGESGKVLVNCLNRNGVDRGDVWLGNLAHFRPEGNKFEHLIGSQQLNDGLTALYARLRANKPTVIATLGNWPMYFLTGKKGKKAGTGITNWRGSILQCNVPGLEDVKVIPTFHPAFVARERSNYPIFDNDIKRIIADAQFPELRLPERKFIINPKGDELERAVQHLLTAKRLSVDIEGYYDGLACVGFSPDPSLGVCIVWDSSVEVRDAIHRLLSSGIPLTFHFGTYDAVVLENYGFTIANYAWDTYIGQTALGPEFPKSLAYLTSVYTREPYYKDERKEEGTDTKVWSRTMQREKLWAYNCKDVCVTSEIQQGQEQEFKDFTPEYRETFDFDMSMLGIARDISKTGMPVDEERRNLLEKALMNQWAEYQQVLNHLVGGELNVNSTKQVPAILYDILKLPPRIDRKTKNRTADEDAIVSLIALTKEKKDASVRKETIKEWTRKFLILKGILLIRGIRKCLSSYILIKRSDDGRIRHILKVGATETGRWSDEKFVDDTGCNTQTFPRDPIFVPEAIEEMIRKGEV